MSIRELQQRASKINGVYSTLKSQKISLDNEVESLDQDIDLLVKTSAVLKHLLDTMVKDEIDKMAGLVTYGLRTIFDDQDLTFMPVVSKKNNRIHIELITQNGEIKGGFGSFGGSVAVIEGFLLRILCILKLKLARLLLLDETFAPVGDLYVPNTSLLIAQMANKLDMDILLVTHQKEFQTHADHVYQVSESSNGLQMTKIK